MAFFPFVGPDYLNKTVNSLISIDTFANETLVLKQKNFTTTYPPPSPILVNILHQSSRDLFISLEITKTDETGKSPSLTQMR